MGVPFTKPTIYDGVAPSVSAATFQPVFDVLKTIADGGAGSGVDADLVRGLTVQANVADLYDFKAWIGTRTYGLNEPCFHNGVPYKSIQAGNIGNTPDISPAFWQVTGGGGNLSNAGYDLDNGDFEANVTGWTTYDDGATAVPVDGTGGAPALVSVARTTTLPLVGVGSMLFTKDAGDAQGEGASSPFTIDLGVRQDPGQIELQIETSASGYVDGDLGIFAYDITNNILIYPSITAIPATYAKPSTFKVVFSPNSTSGSYRLIFHVTSTNAFAWTVKIDNIQIGQKSVATGAVISTDRSYTPAVSPTITLSTVNGKWRKVGGHMEIYFYLTFGGSGSAVPLEVKIPFGYTIDSSVLLALAHGVGHAWWYNGLTVVTVELVKNGGNDGVYFFSPGSASALLGNAVSAGHELSGVITVPISQWTSNVNLTEDFTEYAYNTGSATGADDTTNFGYGSEGTPIIAFSTAVLRRVKFKRPIQDTDQIFLEYRRDTGPWLTVNSTDVEAGLAALQYQNTTSYGAGLFRNTSGDKYTINAYFGNYVYPSGATYGSAGYAWSTLAGNAYRWRVRKVSNGNMAEISGPGTAQQLGNFGYQVSKNKLINGKLDFWQRGGPTPSLTLNTAGGAGAYLADRWTSYARGTSVTDVITRQTFTPGQTLVPGGPNYFMRHAISNGGDGVNGICQTTQFIENVSLLGGKQVTLSFWASHTAAGKIAISLNQNYGTGGSYSTATDTYIQQVQLSTIMTRYSITFNVPSLSGKTLGTDGPQTSATGIYIWMSGGSATNSQQGTLGIQTGTFDFAMFQLEEGSVATAFDDRPYGAELALCQRYYELLNLPGAFFMSSYNGTGFHTHGTSFLTRKRTASPNIAIVSYASAWQWVIPGVSVHSANSVTDVTFQVRDFGFRLQQTRQAGGVAAVTGGTYFLEPPIVLGADAEF
jgi:hypothetical protein